MRYNMYNEPVVVDYFHLLGKSKGVKVSLKCNLCDVMVTRSTETQIQDGNCTARQEKLLRLTIFAL